MHRIHSGFTVAATIKEGKINDLKKVLKSLNNSTDSSLSYFKDSETTLFASGVILPAQDYHGEMLPATFVLATSYFGPFSNHLKDLIKTSKKGLCDIFRNCVDFPEGDLIKDDVVGYYLKSHKHSSAFNSRYNCITKKDVQNEKELRNEIEDYIDKAQHLITLEQFTAVQIKILIQRHIKVNEDKYEWVYESTKKSFIEFLAINRITITYFIIAFLLIVIAFFANPFKNNCLLEIIATTLTTLVTVVILLVILLLIILKYISSKKNLTAPRPEDSYVRKITATQLHPILNEMTAAAPLKAGNLRRHFYAMVLWLIKFVDKLNVPTVSTIRWVVVNNKKRLVFFSNYSNTTDFYVRDFLNDKKTSNGINFIFTNGMGFPDAKLLFKRGITDDPEGYMNAIHADQFVTDLWYAHEPNITVDIINKNRKIREGLFKSMNEDDAKEWLKLL